MLTTFWRLTSLDTGFDRQNVLLVRIGMGGANFPKERRPAVYKQMLDRVRELPGVRSASMSGMTPISRRNWGESLLIDGYTAKSERDTVVKVNSVTAGYFETMGTGFVAGRDFNKYDTPKSPRVAIVNEAFGKKYFGNANPIGKMYHWSLHGEFVPVEIVGVVKDAKYG